MTTSPLQCLGQLNTYYCGFPSALSNVFVCFQIDFLQSSTSDKKEALVKIDWELQCLNYSLSEAMNTCIYTHFMN